MFFFLLIGITTQKLKIIEPAELRNSIGSQIQYSVASFGNIPWGHRLLGHLDKATPELACEELPVYEKQSEFLLVKRGECTFVTKVRNAQAAGYKMVIVGGNTDEVTSDFTMADDGNGFQIQIPSIFIGKKDADFLQQYASYPYEEYKQLLLLMKFEVQQRSNVEVIFALDIEEMDSFKVMEDFSQYYTNLKNASIRYTLMFHMYQTPSETELDDCLFKGQYCAYMSGRQQFGSGKDLVREIQRQLCLFQINPEGYFKYMVIVDECTAPISYDVCSIKVMRNQNIQYNEVLNCFSDSFLDPITQQPTQNFSKAYNPTLDEQIRYNHVLGIQTFPTILINDEFFEGEFSGKGVFEDICSGFIEPPEVCTEQINTVPQQNDQLVNLIVILLSILIIVAVVGYFVCRRILKPSNQETELYVNEMVSQYIKFSEKRNELKVSSQ